MGQSKATVSTCCQRRAGWTRRRTLSTTFPEMRWVKSLLSYGLGDILGGLCTSKNRLRKCDLAKRNISGVLLFHHHFLCQGSVAVFRGSYDFWQTFPFSSRCIHTSIWWLRKGVQNQDNKIDGHDVQLCSGERESALPKCKALGVGPEPANSWPPFCPRMILMKTKTNSVTKKTKPELLEICRPSLPLRLFYFLNIEIRFA